jgi:hypothetical protein
VKHYFFFFMLEWFCWFQVAQSGTFLATPSGVFLQNVCVMATFVL